MSSRNPSGTFTRVGGSRTQEVPVAIKSTERSAFCGCCCTVPRSFVVFLVSFFYLAIAVLSGVAVGTGISNNMSTYHGEVQVDTTKYKVTPVSPSKDLKLWTGWLRYNNGSSPAGGDDLVNLSKASGVLGFIVAFLLVASTVVAAWKFLTTMFCGAKYMRGNTICLALTLSFLLDTFMLAFYLVTFSDMDNLAHSSLGVSANNKVGMVPGSAWFCGFFSGFVWFLVAIFSCGVPHEQMVAYHQF